MELKIKLLSTIINQDKVTYIKKNELVLKKIKFETNISCNLKLSIDLLIILQKKLVDN